MPAIRANELLLCRQQSNTAMQKNSWITATILIQLLHFENVLLSIIVVDAWDERISNAEKICTCREAFGIP